MIAIKKATNGLNIVTIPMAGAKTTAILVIVASGSKHEERNTSGLSHFLEHMFFKGTTNRPEAMAISSELDALGGIYNAFTSKEYTGFWVKTAADKIKPAVAILADMLENSLFIEEEIKRESGVITEEVNMYLDNPMMHIEDVFEELLYGDTPAGWSTIGTKENIAHFTREDFLKYFKSQYRSKSTFVCLAGKLPANAPAFLAQAFKGFASGSAKKKIVTTEKQTKPAIKIKFKATDQAHFSLGVRTVASGHKDEVILKVLGTILGGLTSSRLFVNLRERNGLCYYVRSENENYSDTGYLTTRAGVTVDKIERSIEIVIAEYKKLIEQKVTEEELSRAKEFIAGRLLMGLESPDDIANWYGLQLAIAQQQPKFKKPISPEELLKQIKKVTAADIQRVAKNIFKAKNLNLAVIGPYKDPKKFLSLLSL